VENIIDFNEVSIIDKEPELMDILLFDHSSNKNIKWCTNNYRRHGQGFLATDYIKKELFTHKNRINLIKPRILKSVSEQKKRSRDMAEVFTPSWVCNKQNNLLDDEWFGYKNAFNRELEKSWEATEKVNFPRGKSWKEYVDLERMEITCGEAPYLTSRYDTTSGEYITPLNRIGLLDRKLRVISENINDKDEWLNYAKTAYKRVYGYEYQGDSLLIARENLLMTFIDFYKEKFDESPLLSDLIEIAKIISWNIWQMDGIKFVIPDSCHNEEVKQLSLFPGLESEPEFCTGCRTDNIYKHNGVYCLIKDWKENKVIRFIDLLKGRTING
jgi:hypothetical protein